METNWLYNFIDEKGVEKPTHIPVPEHTYTVLKVIVEPPLNDENRIEDEEYLFFFSDVKRSLNEPNEIIQPEEGRPFVLWKDCLLYTSPSPRDKRQSRMPSSA